MKILVLPKYHREGASSRYRYYNYFEWFRNKGHAVTCKPLLYDGYVHEMYAGKSNFSRTAGLIPGILRRVAYVFIHKKKFDVIIIEKELVTYMPFFIEKLLLRGSVFIVDHDDNINARYQTGWAKLFLQHKIIQLAALSKGVTVGNHWYFDLFKKINHSALHYLPTVIDSRKYMQEAVPERGRDKLTIVWIGSPSTAKYLRLIDDVLAGLQSTYHFTLKIIGARIDLKCNADFVAWDENTEITELTKSDIGIMPLENTDWEKGKCGLKLVQYMAIGLPVIASYSIANKEIIGSDCGFIANSNEEWSHYLSRLLADAALRLRLGENGRSRIFHHYSYQTWSPVFIQLLEGLAEKKVINKPQKQ